MILIEHATIITVDTERRILRDGSVAMNVLEMKIERWIAERKQGGLATKTSR